MVHADTGVPNVIGESVTVGHRVVLHGARIGDRALIGMGARILNGAIIGPQCIVGAGALVTEGKSFEARSLVVGSPARAIRALTDEEVAMLRLSAAHYAEKARHYAEALRAAGPD